MIATLPKPIPYRALALAYEDEVLRAWNHLRATRLRRDVARLMRDERTALRLSLDAKDSKAYLQEMLNIRKRARGMGR